MQILKVLVGSYYNDGPIKLAPDALTAEQTKGRQGRTIVFNIKLKDALLSYLRTPPPQGVPVRFRPEAPFFTFQEKLSAGIFQVR